MSAALRLHVPTTDGSGASAPPRLSLRSLHQDLMLPHLEELGRKADTIGEYATHLERWEEFWTAGGPPAERSKPKDATSLGSQFEPETKGVTSEHLLSFRRWLGKAYPDFCARTKNKHVKTLEKIIKRAHKFGRLPGLIEIDPLPYVSVAPKHYLLEEQLASLYMACDVARWPRGPQAVDQWRTLVVMWATYGPRTQELVSVDRHHRPLTWGQVTWECETPNPIGRAISRYGWFSYVPQKQERFKPEPLYLPLTEIMAAHLRSIMPAERPAMGDPVFAFPRCNKSFYAQWHALVAAARIKPKGPAEVKYLIKHLRKTCATRLNLHRRGLATLVIGHGDRDVTGNVVLGGKRDESRITDEHYDNAEESIVEGLLSLPEPAVFRRIFDRRQLTLF